MLFIHNAISYNEASRGFSATAELSRQKRLDRRGSWWKWENFIRKDINAPQQIVSEILSRISQNLK